MENYSEYLGRKLSVREIFNKFIGKTVAGESDSSEWPPDMYITIRYIGKYEEAVKLQEDSYFEAGLRFGVIKCRPERTGTGVIYNSDYNLMQLIGLWNTSVTADGGMRNESMVLMPDGRGGFRESVVWTTAFDWYLENNILTICCETKILYQDEILYEPKVLVPCMSGEDRYFSRLDGAWGLIYYRPLNITTMRQAYESAERGYRLLKVDTAMESW